MTEQFKVEVFVTRDCDEKITPSDVLNWMEDILHGCDMVEVSTIQVFNYGDPEAKAIKQIQK